jgi:multidrug efflux system membrane fusion protein
MMSFRTGNAVLLAGLLVVGACGKADAPIEEQLRPVRYISVADASAFRDRSFSGTSKSSRESRLSFKVSGTVMSIPVQIGQRLNAGDLIAEIDSDSYILQVQQAQASLVEAQANDRKAAADYQRAKGLYANDNASLNDLDAARAQAESSGAMVASAGKALEIARLNLSYTKLSADTECSIASLNIEVNENAQAGQQVAAVSCGDTYEITMNLPESLIGLVDNSTPVRISFSSIPNRQFKGEISEISVSSASGTAGFPVVIRIVETDPSLRSGLTANVTFQFDSAAASGAGVVIPVNAVISDPAGTFVFIASESGPEGEATVTRRPVEVGELSQYGIEVVDGLIVGDLVITAGISVIRPGQRVLVSAEAE